MSFLVTLGLAFALSYAAWEIHEGGVGVVGAVTTVLWTIPLSSSLLGMAGCLRTRRVLRARRDEPLVGPAPEILIVVVPTIGRLDTLPALERVVASYRQHLPAMFPRMRVDVVIEENCAAREAIAAMAGPLVRILTVPANYSTPRGTRFKARANHFANVRRIAEGEANDDVWVLHMDDDTGVGPDTATELARFVGAQRRKDPLHLAQGVLTYPREHATRRLIWLADAIRPSQDVSLYAITTGRGTPLAGLHGELLIVRASVEAEIGWDFGPRAVVEDSQFALAFAQRHPGRSGWFPGRSFGATPASVGDLLKQRERWAWGLLELSVDGRIPLKYRLLLIHNMIVWSCGPAQHIGVIVVAGSLLGDYNTFPAIAALLPLWAVNIGFQVWTYWEGLTLNARASTQQRVRLLERLIQLPLLPIFSLWEAAGFLRGFVRFIRHYEPAFAVISKPL
jgi:beta-1,4-mannosyltransferase